MPEQSNDYRVVVFGAGGVGKSSLVLRFVKGSFRESYIPTIEDTYRQVISCDKNICTLQITDTTGSHQFPAMQRLSISKGHAFILVYSVCSRQSLEELRPIWAVIRELKGQDISQIPIMLVRTRRNTSICFSFQFLSYPDAAKPINRTSAFELVYKYTVQLILHPFAA
ncbi:GTP-binding protein Di-Ras2 [Pogonomyrmex barbatus]|uniref:GTP-binding protein Di-Ras2 n=1 Tax=Pogonomyrmex barbatus TaxID=144034 RepID=A0A8N1S4P5_9HYME|nr:GTP-binding protein Di-Ras2 [Pogonomyrmex barbatus]